MMMLKHVSRIDTTGWESSSINKQVSNFFKLKHCRNVNKLE